MDSHPVVPRNKQQERHVLSRQEHHEPDPFSERTLPCTIIKTFDQDTLMTSGAPAELASQLINFPGCLWALVMLTDGKTMFLPFKQPGEFIFLVYGNHVLLNGQPATIVYTNRDPQAGFLVMRRRCKTKNVEMSKIGKALDIGGIV